MHVRHFIYDLCFSSPKVSTTVLCATEPWRNAGVKLHLTQPLPRSMANRAAASLHNPPWALELYGGRHCIFDTGASGVVQGLRANYFCGAGSAELFGFPARHTQPWTIPSGRVLLKQLSRSERIRRAWM
jgi:hypothetical protein